MNGNFFGTKDDFIKNEIRAWGEDYITSLLDTGYDAVLTTAGWKWIIPSYVKIEIRDLTR